MKIKIEKECTIERPKKDDLYYGIDIFLLPSIQFYYEFSKAIYDGELKCAIAFFFLFWEIDIEFLHTNKHEKKN